MAGLIRARALQQKFLHRLISAQELERKRLAGELHDSLGQRLTIAKNLSQILHRDSTDGNHCFDISGITTEISEALREVREISYDLRPTQLDYMGLREALEELLKKVSRSSDVAFTHHFDDVNDLLTKDAQINLYRVVQECLSNMVKHSRARHGTLSLTRQANQIWLEISDDGVGFNLNAASTHSGLGLTSISERVQLLEGKIIIRSTTGKGTTIHIEVDRSRMPAIKSAEESA
jgi:signal transduction histidine kinase